MKFAIYLIVITLFALSIFLFESRDKAQFTDRLTSAEAAPSPQKQKQHLLKALKLAKRIYGEEHAKVMMVYARLAEAYRENREFDKAIQTNQKALDMFPIIIKDKNAHREQYPEDVDYRIARDIATITGQLGNTYEKKVEWELQQGIPLEIKSLHLAEKYSRDALKQFKMVEEKWGKKNSTISMIEYRLRKIEETKNKIKIQHVE